MPNVKELKTEGIFLALAFQSSGKHEIMYALTHLFRSVLARLHLSRGHIQRACAEAAVTRAASFTYLPAYLMYI